MPAPPDRVTVRDARRADAELIFSLILELAEYEQGRDQVVGSAGLLEAALFGPHPSAEALIAEVESEPVAFALFYRTFSTWECQAGIWLEDLYVPPEHRRLGIGGLLLARLAQITIERGFARLEWAVLDWTTPALSFYEKLGAARLDEWRMHRLDGAALEWVALGTAVTG
jgi:GNAT superfamily N-acetyltransferase